MFHKSENQLYVVAITKLFNIVAIELGESQLYVVAITKLFNTITIELRAIICYQGIWDLKLANDWLS